MKFACIKILFLTQVLLFTNIFGQNNQKINQIETFLKKKTEKNTQLKKYYYTKLPVIQGYSKINYLPFESINTSAYLIDSIGENQESMQRKCIYNYNDVQNLTSEFYLTKTNSVWKNLWHITYSYNDAGEKTQLFFEVWDGERWSNYWRETYEYN